MDEELGEGRRVARQKFVRVRLAQMEKDSRGFGVVDPRRGEEGQAAVPADDRVGHQAETAGGC